MTFSIRSIGAVALALSAAGGFTRVHAQQPALPTASELIGRYLKATNLEAATKTHSSVRKKGKISQPAMGISGTIELLNAKPNRSLQRATVTGIGETRRGYDGEHGWALDPVQGPRLLVASELNNIRDEAGFAVGLRDSVSFRVRETVELAELGGQKCYRVKMVTNGGRETFDCFSTETGLLVATQGKVATAMGTVESTVLYSDYKSFSGVLIATKAAQQVNGRETVITLETVEFDNVKPEELALPPEVRALIKS